jgi:(p)ppGpp synthase/HD superfamily hydrolase
MLNNAINIAIFAHKTQVDKGGHPYIFHPLRLMIKFENEIEKIVAVLHDVVEDSDFSLEDLRSEFSDEIIDALDHLTRRSTEEYDAFISRVMQNQLASKIKMADLQDNMDLSRIPDPSEVDINRIKKYEKAYSRLSEKMTSKLK